MDMKDVIKLIDDYPDIREEFAKQLIKWIMDQLSAEFVLDDIFEHLIYRNEGFEDKLHNFVLSQIEVRAKNEL